MSITFLADLPTNLLVTDLVVGADDEDEEEDDEEEMGPGAEDDDEYDDSDANGTTDSEKGCGIKSSSSESLSESLLSCTSRTQSS